jgi:septal ring factor EnvC (AmiA/AmiB activator)
MSKTLRVTSLGLYRINTLNPFFYAAVNLCSSPRSNYFHTNLQHCSDVGRLAFLEAQKRMNSLRSISKTIISDRGRISFIIDLLEDIEDARDNLKPEMDALAKSAKDCQINAEEIGKRFEYWESVIIHLKQCSLSHKGTLHISLSHFFVDYPSIISILHLHLVQMRDEIIIIPSTIVIRPSLTQQLGITVQKEKDNTVKKDRADAERVMWTGKREQAECESRNLQILLKEAQNNVQRAQRALDDLIMRPPPEQPSAWEDVAYAQRFVPDMGPISRGNIASVYFYRDSV